MHENEIIEKFKNYVHVYGNKAAADLIFSELGVGIGARIFEPNESIDYIKDKLIEETSLKKPWVIRFSKDNEINLPVGINLFSVDETILFINKKRKPGFSTILCPMFEIKNSFEVYFEDDGLHISVMPGKWDITSNAPTDLIKINKNTLIFNIYNKPREMKLEHISIKNPFSVNELRGIAEFVLNNKPILSALKKIYNPLFVRGWQDNKDNFCFANCRRSNHKFDTRSTFDKLIHIYSAKDITKITNCNVPILFEVCANERENDQNLYSLGLKLKNMGVNTIFCKSILSHQAIILREVGLETIQYMPKSDYIVKEEKVEEWKKIQLMMN